MADINQQPAWQPGGPGSEILKQQAAELEETHLAAEQKKAAEEQAAQEAAMAMNLAQNREAERLTASIMLMQQSGEPGVSGESSPLSPTAEIDAKIAKLQKSISNEYITPYLFLTTGAAVIDTLQFISDVSLIASILASGLGLGFSFARHYGLKYANPNATNEEKRDALNRTLISGAVSFIPFVNALPEQTGIMIREWTIKRTAIIQASAEIIKLQTLRNKILSKRPLPN